MSLAVDTTVFQPLCEGARTTVRDQLGLTGTVVGFVGRLTKAKGLDILMSALEHVHTSQEWSLLLLGGGDYEEKILAWAERRGWSDRMKIKLVPHSEVPRYVGCMDVLVAPSQSAKNWREQFGRMLVEAFACGVPVIASDSGEIPFVVGDAGKIVGERDVAAWARALEKFICDREARADFGRRGLVRANQFSVTTIAAQYRDYFQWLDKRPVLTS
jgi:glycosyltransferase involved in cell wall biosynthesis